MQSPALVKTHYSHLVAHCRARGYSLEEVMPCVVEQDGDQWVIDTSHAAYPKERGGVQPQQASMGPGEELKALLARFGIRSTPDCQCSKRARYMDEMESNQPGWCEQNIETICDWLQEEANKRNLPFLRAVGKLLIRRAISNARNKGQ